MFNGPKIVQQPGWKAAGRQCLPDTNRRYSGLRDQIDSVGQNKSESSDVSGSTQGSNQAQRSSALLSQQAKQDLLPTGTAESACDAERLFSFQEKES